MQEFKVYVATSALIFAFLNIGCYNITSDMNHIKPTRYADDDFESIGTLLKLRAPALVLGLLLGIGISFVVSNFEAVIARNVQVAFFMPFVVYIADAIGTQTEAIYSRDLKSGKAKFKNYLHKELILGLIFGLIFGCVAGGFVSLWLGNDRLAATVALASFFAVSTAPIVALIITQTLQSLHEDPAAGSGPIATVLQDLISIIIYGVVASIMIL